MTLPRTIFAGFRGRDFSLWLILALAALPWWGVAACAKPFLVHPAVESEDPPPEPTDDPVLVQPTEAIFVNNADGNATFTFTPTVVQGENLTFDIVGGTLPGSLTEGDDFDPETGELTGSVGSSHGSGTYQIRATNADFVSVTETPFDFYDIWVRWHKYTSTGTIGNGDGSPQYLSVAGRLYDQTADIYADGAAIGITAANVGFRGNGYKVYSDQATPIVIANNGFEADSDWDFTNAPNADYFAGNYLDNTLFAGSRSLCFSCPAADEEYVESTGTVALEPETTYVLAIHASYGDNTAGKDYDNNPGVDMYVELVGTGEETTVRAVKSNSNTRGIEFIWAEFTTPAGSPTYKVRVGVEDGDLSSGPDVYFDRVVISRARAIGVVVGPQNWDSLTPEEITSYGLANGTTLSGVTVVPGDDQSNFGHAVASISSSNLGIVGCDLTCNGPNSSCYRLNESSIQADDFAFLASEFTSLNQISSSRDNGLGAVLSRPARTVAHCTITDGPISGILCPQATGTHTAAFNSIRLKARYTNCFAIFTGTNGSLAYRNVINNDEAPYESRGIMLGPDASAFGNSVTSRDGGNNQEYSGPQLGGVHLNQQEVRTGGIIAYETNTLLGSAGNCFRVGPDDDVAGTGTRLYDHCTGIVNATDPMPEGTAGHTPACIKTANVELDNVEFVDCDFTTNNAFVTARRSDSWAGTTGTLLINRPTIEHVDDDLSWAFAWVIGYPSNQDFACCVRDPVYADAGSRSFIDSQPRNSFGTTGGLSGTIAIWEENTCTVTLTVDGSPLANTAVVVTDEQENEVFNDETDAEGQITFVAKNWQWSATTRTSYKTHTFSVEGYADATADLTDTNKTPTVPLTAE